MSSDVMEFGFEDTKVIKPQGMEQLKLTRPGERAAMSIISFKDYHSAAMMKKTREKGSPLDEEEKANIFKLVDEKLAEKLGKSVSDLTEIDRLDYQSPRFWVSFTHYRDGLGTIKCLSKYEGSQIVKPEICCDEIGEASQTIGTIVLKYPTDKDGNVDLDLLKMKKQTEVLLFKMTPAKFKKIESVYADARKNKYPVIDIKLELDGDPKYQKLVFQNGYTASWLDDDVTEDVRRWILDQGIKAQKHVKGVLGYDMKKDALIQKLRGGSESPEGNASRPQLASGYDKLIS